MWQEGIREETQKVNIEKELREKTGYLSEKESIDWLIKYFKTNIYQAGLYISGVKLFPFQEIMIKTMLQKDYTLGILSRGIGKSWSTGIYAFLEAIFTPNCKIAIISRSFRQSRLIFQNIEDVSKKAEASLLAECFAGTPVHANDEWTMKFNNGSVIKALPLGSGDKLRGFRFNVLIIDELLLMPEKILNEVIMPFLSTNADVANRSEVVETEKKLVAAGLLKEKDKTKFKNNKMIGLSSASYQCEHLYKIYKDYIGKILSGTSDGKSLLKDGSNKLLGSYSVFQFAYDIAPEGLYNEALLEKSRTESSKAQFAREFGSQFTDDSAGYFNMVSMEKCSIPSGSTPATEIFGSTNGEYILSIDPNASESDTSDFFAMVLLKINEDGSCTQVNSYAIAGAKYSENIKYLKYLIKNFNIKMIVMDNAGGIQFLRSCNESKEFQDDKNGKIELELMDDIDVFNADDEKEMAKMQKKFKSISLSGKIPVYTQVFKTDWIRNANEYLQFCIDSKNIYWASDLSCLDRQFKEAYNKDINIKDFSFQNEVSDDYQKFEKNKGTVAKQIDFIEHQYYLIELTKRQCASIEPRATQTGTLQFVLPTNLQSQSGPNRARRDLYSALFMGNWANLIYKKMINAKATSGQSDWEQALSLF